MGHALTPQTECEYTLAEEHNSVWITVENLSVYIKRNDEGVSVSIYPRGAEDDDAITETWATYNDAITEKDV